MGRDERGPLARPDPDQHERPAGVEVAVMVRVRDEPQRDGERRQRHRPGVQVQDRPTLAEADAAEAVVEVVRIRPVERPAVLRPLEHDERRVEERDREHEQREQQREHGRGLHETLDRDAPEQQAKQVRPAVAHVHARRVEVVDQEPERRARGDRREHPGVVAGQVERDDRERDRADRAHARRQAVDAVGEVDDVHDGDQADHREDAATRRAKVDVAEERKRDDRDLDVGQLTRRQLEHPRFALIVEPGPVL